MQADNLSLTVFLFLVGMVLTTTLHYIREAEQRAEEGCDCAEAFAAAERSLTVRICDYVHHANA